MAKRTLCLWLGILSLFVFGCEPEASRKARQEHPVYTSFRDIPGVTAEEIAAIERLQAKKRSFVFGMNPSTELFTEEDGSAGGYSVLLCDWLTTLFGMSFKPTLYEWDDLMVGLQSHVVDFTGEMTPTEERRQHYFMTDSIAERTIKRVSVKGSEALSRTEKQRPLRYVFLEDATTRELVWPFVRQDSKYVFAGNYGEVYRLLQEDKVDAFLDESPSEASFEAYGDVVVEDFYPLTFSPVSMTTQNPELAPIISVVQKALHHGSSYHLTQLYNQGYAAYRRHKLFMQLTAEEKAYIREHSAPDRAIPLAIEYANYPVSFYNEQEEAWQGIALDVLKEIEQLTGLTFARAHEGRVEWPDLLAMLVRGEVALVTELIPSETRRGRFLWPDIPYQIDKYALLSRADHPAIKPNEILYARVGLLADTTYTEVFRAWFPEHKNTVEYVNNYEAFNALERGDVDFLMMTQNLLLNVTNYLERPGFKVNVLFNRPYESTFGIHVEEAMLRSIMSKALRVIDTQGITQHWSHKMFDYRLKMAEAKLPWLIGVSVLMFCVVTLLLVLYQSRSMEKRLENLVQTRTAELREQRDLLAQMSMTDQLTGIPNRRSFNDRIHHEWRVALREKMPLSILVLDVDRFKHFNDAYGHQQGDAVLREVAKTITQALNRPGDFAARWGGEEFIVLLPNTDAHGALKIAESIRAHVEELEIAISENVVARVTISIGGHTQIPVPNSSIDSFISIADNLLYNRLFKNPCA
jgi:diguanylate cyclase (GGDEF)-like protein